MACIYSITNIITGQKYIGKTTYTLDKRWKQHINCFNEGKKNHLKLYTAFKEYGVENFIVSEVEKVSDINKLCEREKYWIDTYNTHNNGYNGNAGGGQPTLYDYDFIWELWQEGKNIKEISSIVGCNDFVVRSCLNSHDVPTEERNQRSVDSVIETHEPYMRKVQKKVLGTDIVICTYNSVSEAAKDVGRDSSYLSRVCKQNGNTCGYSWSYEGNNYVKKDFSSKKVGQLDIATGAILHVFPSLTEAATAVNGNTSYISKVCRGIQRSSKGYGWKFV